MRIGAKIVLARLPVRYRIWKQLRVFEYGDMNEPGRALDTTFGFPTRPGKESFGRSSGFYTNRIRFREMLAPSSARALNAILRE